MPSPNGQLPPDRRFFGVVLTAETAARLRELSVARGTTASEIVRQAIAVALEDETPKQDKVA